MFAKITRSAKKSVGNESFPEYELQGDSRSAGFVGRFCPHAREESLQVDSGINVCDMFIPVF